MGFSVGNSLHGPGYACFKGRHKPVHGGLAIAVLAIDTLETGIP